MHKIVVIEDSSFMRARITSLLRSHGFDNIEDYTMADDIGKKPHLYLDRVDLIIADIQLPGISGIEMVGKIKKDGRYAHVPIIFVSGFGDPKTIGAAFKAGAADYIIKPFDNNVFMEKVKKVLGGAFDLPPEYMYDEEQFTETVSNEYQRATRGNQCVSFLRIKVNSADLTRSAILAKNKTRRIDTTCVYKNSIFLILPITDGVGLDIVRIKLKMLFDENNIALLDGSAYTFSGDRSIPLVDVIREVLQLAK